MLGTVAGHARASVRLWIDDNIVSFMPMRPTRSDIRIAYDAALAAVEPRAAVVRSMSFEASVLTVGSHTFENVSASDVVVVALGKAASAMALGAHDVVGGDRGFVVTSSASPTPFPTCVGSHPIPDASSLACGGSLLAVVENTSPSDVVVFLISGGGSATATLPVAGVTIEDVSLMNAQLIASGLPIEDVNEVRASVSRLKGGRLGLSTTAERQVTLVLSDVVGVGSEHVASGPSLGFGLGQRAGNVLEISRLRTKMPPAVVAAADAFVPLDRPTPLLHTTIGSPAIAAAAAAGELRSRGFDASVATTELKGEARLEASALLEQTPPGAVSVAAGETTVTIHGEGIGGRNQEAALAAALHIGGQDALFAALGTDGIDGPTAAAGAVVDGGTASRAVGLGIDLNAALARNDSHSVLTALGETVVVGATGTNVADLWIAAKGPF